MFSRLRSAITYANAVSTPALFLALGGAACAATTLAANRVGTGQIQSGAVTQGKINSSARAALRGNTGPQGLRGLAGKTGTYPTVLPSCETETGAFAVRFLAEGGDRTGDA